MVETQAAPGYQLPDPAIVGIFYPNVVNGENFQPDSTYGSAHAVIPESTRSKAPPKSPGATRAKR